MVLGFATSCFVRQPLTFGALESDFGALLIVDAKLDAGILAEVELSQIPIEMLLIDVLVDADDPTLEHGKEAFKGVGVHVAARPFKLGMIHALVLGKAAQLVMLRHVGHQPAILMHHRAQMRADAAVIERHRTDIAAALNEAKHFGVVAATAEAGRALGLARPSQFGFVSLNGLASATQWANVASRCHRQPNAVAQKPCRLHAAIEHSLNLASADAFLARAHQVNDLKPQVQGQVRGLKNGPHAHRERLFAGIAFVQARTGRLAVQTADLGVIRVPAVRTRRAIGPQCGFDKRKSGGFILKMWRGKDGLSHG